MKTSILLAASISLAFATCAFAQDDNMSNSSTDDTSMPAPTDQSADMSKSDMNMDKSNMDKSDMSMDKSDMGMKKSGMKHTMKHHKAHVAGDPMHIDHSADHMIVTPTVSHMDVPANK